LKYFWGSGFEVFWGPPTKREVPACKPSKSPLEVSEKNRPPGGHITPGWTHESESRIPKASPGQLVHIKHSKEAVRG